MSQKKRCINIDISHFAYLHIFTGHEDSNLHTNHHPHSPTFSFWYRLNRLIIRLCSTHQFKNLQVS